MPIILLKALGWLTGSKLGRYAAIALIVGAAIAYALYSARRSGIKAEQAKQLAKSLNNLRTRIKTDEDISRLEPDARRQRLREWARGE
jgi:hypothetical protein